MASKLPHPRIQPQARRLRDPVRPNPVHNPSTDINILLLGPTGTGKTTFINAMANYMSFDTIEQAVRGEMQVLIPSSITFPYGDEQEDRTIIIGDPNQFERFDQIGESATQLCRSFVFTIGGRRLRFIDAPGIGDTRGVEQDEKNFQEILSFISQYDHINALCVLLKPNEDRLTVTFKFCVTELLRHLHIDSRQNLIFVYTNARATFYRPGSSGKLLRILFEKYRADCGLEVPLSVENTFIFDNEAFRYLAIRKHNFELDEEQTASYCRSWSHSVKEMLRFLGYVCSRPPHRVQSIKSLNTAEQLIRKLPRPIAEATRLIEVNLEQAQRYKERVMQNLAVAEEGVPQNLGVIRRLKYPRTVCASEKCRTIIETEDEMRVHYKSVCHDECYLHQVQQETLAHPKLEDCTAINYKTGICEHCGCHWQSHQHITYEYISNRTRLRFPLGTGPIVTDQSVFLRDLDRRINSLRDESGTIQDNYKRFAVFLKKKAMLPINDNYIAYVEYFIRLEREKANAAEHLEVIANLERIVQDFRNHIETFDRTIRENPDQDETDLTPTEVFELAEQLFALPITGVLIKEQVDAIDEGERQVAGQREHSVRLLANAATSQILTELTRIFNAAP